MRCPSCLEVIQLRATETGVPSTPSAANRSDFEGWMVGDLGADDVVDFTDLIHGEKPSANQCSCISLR